MRGSDRTICDVSRSDDHEPLPRVEYVSPAELRDELVRVEVALVDVVARAVVEDALVDLLASDACAHSCVDHDELGREPARLRQETFAVLVAQVAVEVACE